MRCLGIIQLWQSGHCVLSFQLLCVTVKKQQNINLKAKYSCLIGLIACRDINGPAGTEQELDEHTQGICVVFAGPALTLNEYRGD